MVFKGAEVFGPDQVSTDDVAGQSMRKMRGYVSTYPDKPFFLRFAINAPHIKP